MDNRKTPERKLIRARQINNNIFLEMAGTQTNSGHKEILGKSKVNIFSTHDKKKKKNTSCPQIKATTFNCTFKEQIRAIHYKKSSVKRSSF